MEYKNRDLSRMSYRTGNDDKQTYSSRGQEPHNYSFNREKRKYEDTQERPKINTKATGIIAYFSLIGFFIAYILGDKKGAALHINMAFNLIIVEVLSGFLSYFLYPFGFLIRVINLIIAGTIIYCIVCAVLDKAPQVPVLKDIKIIIQEDEL